MIFSIRLNFIRRFPKTMTSPQESAITIDFVMLDPKYMFGIGLISGAIIGFDGIIILTLAGAGYYYRDILIEVGHDTITRINNQRQTSPGTWSDWGRSWVGLTAATDTKKTE
jgi:hypothetical protein